MYTWRDRKIKETKEGTNHHQIRQTAINDVSNSHPRDPLGETEVNPPFVSISSKWAPLFWCLICCISNQSPYNRYALIVLKFLMRSESSYDFKEFRYNMVLSSHLGWILPQDRRILSIIGANGRKSYIVPVVCWCPVS